MGEPPTSPASDTANNSGVSLLLLAVGLVLALILAWMGRVILLLIFAAIVVAVLLTAIVDWIKPKLHLRRGLAFALILLTAATLLFLTLWISGPNIIEQFSNLQTDLPQAAHQLVERAKGYGWVAGCSPNGRTIPNYLTASAMPLRVSAASSSAPQACSLASSLSHF
jgi:predicted PurR-regulated permease PerM